MKFRIHKRVLLTNCPVIVLGSCRKKAQNELEKPSFQEKTRFLAVFLNIGIVLFGCGEDSPVSPVPPVEEPQVGVVSGTITNARTGRPVRDAIVKLSGRQWITDVEGRYRFAQVDFSDAIAISVEAVDYAVEKRIVALKTETLAVDMALAPLTDPEVEIRELLTTFSERIESLEVDKLEEIEGLFTEDYITSDDLVTRFFGRNTGVIPVNYADVVPAITALREEFNLLQYRFRDIEMDVPHPRQASARLRLDIVTEKGARSARREIAATCKLYFRKEESGWKIFFWQFLEADVRL